MKGFNGKVADFIVNAISLGVFTQLWVYSPNRITTPFQLPVGWLVMVLFSQDFASQVVTFQSLAL